MNAERTQVLVLVLHLTEKREGTAGSGVAAAGDDCSILNETHTVAEREDRLGAFAGLRAELGKTRGRVQSAVCSQRADVMDTLRRMWRGSLTNSTGFGVQLVRRVGNVLDLDRRFPLRQNQLRMHL